MSAAIDLQFRVGDYFNLAQKYFSETVDLALISHKSQVHRGSD